MAGASPNAGISTVPAATGGVDFYNSLFGMPPENAIQLINWWPEVYGCSHRKGYRHWAGGIEDHPIGSLYTYHTNSSTGGSYLYAFSNGSMWDVSQADTAYPAPARTAVVTGLSTDIWQATMFANSGKTNKVFVSGQDNPIWLHQTAPPAVIYDRLIAGDGIVPGTISGFDPKNAIDVTIHQSRLWFVEKDTGYGWYLEPNVAYGVASVFDFTPLFKRGGYLQSLATWTVDDGDGADDLLVAFSSEGDVAVYKGIDPSGDLSTWSLQGVYYAGAPLKGHRFHCKVSGDLKFLTQQGLVSMNDMLTSTRVVSPQSNVEAQPVQQFLAEQASVFGGLEGWDMKFVSSINMLLINIPGVTVDGDLQVAENVVNTKWSTFRSMNMTCICADFQDVFFFGSTLGNVMQGWTGNSDHVNVFNLPAGNPITAVVQQAYNYFGTPATNKQVGMYRPNFLLGGDLQWKSSINYDFEFATAEVPGSSLSIGTPRWDQAIWDDARWAGGQRVQKEWAQAQGYGFAASLSMATRSSGPVTWVNTDWTIKSGGVL